MSIRIDPPYRVRRRVNALFAASVAAVILGLALDMRATVPPAVQDAQVDRVFARWTESTPGCAVGASMNGKPVLAKGYGLADLEHGVRITPDTIFEAGSVSKQFTAAAVLLLAREGKLSLDDQARKYIPELPDYGMSLTIRHMLNHTSGLRDWGSVEAIAGWPRSTRVYTHAHVLEIVSRQHALNFTPGTKWSYSNTGYNLAAIIVSRVSGMPFARFTKERLFEPLGMTHTSWRDDHTRVVPNRAVAYNDAKDGFHTDMPFEDVYGNGGLLTTVGDLLKWNQNFASPKVGDQAFVAQQLQPGKFNDGRAHTYAFGLVATNFGTRSVEHSGSTAGYSAHLMRYPDQGVSVAVLCNVTTDATPLAHDVADLYLSADVKSAMKAAIPPAPPALPDTSGGLYRHVDTGVVLTAGRPGDTWRDEGGGRLRVTDYMGTVENYTRVAAVSPSAQELKEFTGIYTSDEAETSYQAVVQNQTLVLKRRPDTVIELKPIYEDAFDGPHLGLVIFRRDASGRVTALSVHQDRVWDLRFKRVTGS